MPLFFQVHHVFRNNNCTHDIYTATDVTHLKYPPRIITTCGSDSSGSDSSSNNNRVISDVEEDEFINTYEYDHESIESIESIESVWMLFQFYENSIIAMSIFTNQKHDEAINAFNILRNESHMAPTYNESSVLEKDASGNAMYSLYVKCDGVYMLPDKAQRIVLQKINIFDEVTSI